MAIPDGRKPVYKYSGRDFIDIYSFERKRGQYGLSGNYQFGRQRLRFDDFKYSDRHYPRSDFDYDAAGRF